MAIRSERWLLRGVWGNLGAGDKPDASSMIWAGCLLCSAGCGRVHRLPHTAVFSGADTYGCAGQGRGVILHGAGVLVFGLAMGAFGVLPRLEYNALSNLSGGYLVEARARGGWSLGDGRCC
ncbi:MAG: hypothetical protein JOZ19_02460 [Rubrobacter sp.]|nr:hypothetical protein [Rubrobacter sp.]